MIAFLGIFDRPDIYKQLVMAEMKKLGATKDELALVSEEAVWNGFVNHRLPEDVAWALLQ